jgi:hypothetical protein
METANVVSGDTTYATGLSQPLTQTAGGRLRVDASGSSSAAAPLPSGTDRSGQITTGGTAQQLAAANAARISLSGQNISTGDLWINEIGGTAAADTAGSYRVAAGVSFSISTSRAVSIVGATTAQKWSATET